MIPRSRLLKFEQWPDILRHGLTGAGKSMLLHWGSLFSGQSTSTVLVIPEDKAP
jgi:DNA repair ATPase RecN